MLNVVLNKLSMDIIQANSKNWLPFFLFVFFTFFRRRDSIPIFRTAPLIGLAVRDLWGCWARRGGGGTILTYPYSSLPSAGLRGSDPEPHTAFPILHLLPEVDHVRPPNAYLWPGPQSFCPSHPPPLSNDANRMEIFLTRNPFNNIFFCIIGEQRSESVLKGPCLPEVSGDKRRTFSKRTT